MRAAVLAGTLPLVLGGSEKCGLITPIEQTLWPDHCVQGTLDAELHSDLIRDPSDTREIYMKKGDRPNVDSYSAFKDNAGATDTGLDMMLRKRGISEVYVAGLATDYCVWFSARDAAKLGYRVTVVEDATRPISPHTVLEHKAESKTLSPEIGWTVSSEVRPSESAALLVVDVQNCFSSTGTLPVGVTGKDSAGESVVPVVNRLRDGGWGAIVYTQDWHLPNQTSFASQHAHDGCEAFQTHTFLCHDEDCCRVGDSRAADKPGSVSCECVLERVLCAQPNATAPAPFTFDTEMQLYDDSRSQFVRGVLREFGHLPAGADAKSKHTFLRSVDVMSYTVGVQQYYDSHPPLPLAGAGNPWSGEEAAALTAQAAGLGSPHERAAISLLLSGMGEDLRAADIGSGYGGWVRLLASRPEFGAVHGVEPRKAVRDMSAAMFKFAGFAQAEAWESSGGAADAFTFLGEVSSPLDVVVSHLCFLHIGSTVAERQLLLDAIGGGLRAGGRLYFEDFVATPAALGHAEYRAKLDRVVWMKTLFPAGDYVGMLKAAGFGPVGGRTAMAWDVTATWAEFVYARWKAFSALTVEHSMCYDAETGAVVPAKSPNPAAAHCASLTDVFGDAAAAGQYLSSQSQFVCEVCELFWGKGDEALRDCGCPEYGQKSLRNHPPLAGGVLAMAERL
eukprot:TRINITY_DN4930_c2_g2_i1.p1 TRINITY_DN4930_c2_g2~~TRINITY_DN4930_c2_g2_i1.p1  ORF type:complete len:702 (+),score=252.12 TRINITY_DN4930_c2_g2_i1:82-2106(+)